jgi:hypothetical protein
MFIRSLLMRFLMLWIMLALPLSTAVVAETTLTEEASQASVGTRVYLPIISAPPRLPTFDYAVAMRPAFAHEVDRPDLPHYDLTFRVDPLNRRLNGRVELWFRNTTGSTLRDVVLRLYPNFPADFFGDGGGGSMSVSNVLVQNVATAPRYEAQNTAVRLPLPAAVAPNQVIRIALNFQGAFSPWADGTFPLPSFYPMLAAWDGGWRTDVSRFPDRVYASSGLYHARITIPTGWAAASTGTNLDLVDHGNGTQIYDVVTGSVREFALSIGRMDYLLAEHDGTTVVVWYKRNSGLASIARTTANDIVAALKTFNERYGPYPYRALECRLVLDTGHINFGSEYPGLVFVYTTGTYTNGLRYTRSHEIAHQWFYNVLGNGYLQRAVAGRSVRQVQLGDRRRILAGPGGSRRLLPERSAPLCSRGDAAGRAIRVGVRHMAALSSGGVQAGCAILAYVAWPNR